MLLRQLYLSHFEGRRFGEAHDVAVEAIDLDVLTDVLYQDAARAAAADGRIERALGYLRAASRRGPASRRPFHLWTLGSILFLARRFEEAAHVLERATRWATRDKPLYRAHLALARLGAGGLVHDLRETIDALAEAPCGQGYGRFVLGHLAYAAGEWEPAQRYLEAFIKRTTSSRTAMGIALEGEVRAAKLTLAKMASN
jgi:tetratricopeptide (TPR) repeat protein